MSINESSPKLTKYSKDYKRDYNTANEYRRIPNHICRVKRELMVRVSFPNILKGEDSGYSKLLLPYLKTEHAIDKLLYHYDYNDTTTETHTQMDDKVLIPNEKPIVDVVILSNAHKDTLRRMTQTAVNSCIKGANGLSVNIIVMEQDTNVYYEHATTHHKAGDFGYNSFANQGAGLGNADWIMTANNDLVFNDAWLHSLLAAGHHLVSPKCPKDPRQADISCNEIGETNGKHFSGWCYMISRCLWNKISGFDEDFTGWFADDAVIEQCKAIGVLPMLVPDAMVRHYGSITLRELPKDEMDNMTWGQVDKFNAKYGKSKFEDHPGYVKWKQRNESVSV